jgi:predicted transcriptional regulator
VSNADATVRRKPRRLAPRPRPGIRLEALSGVELERSVLDAAIRHPKVCRADASVGEMRQLFLDDHVHMALLVDGERLVSCLDRDDVGADMPDTAFAIEAGGLSGCTVAAQAPLREAVIHLQKAGRRRLAVVNEQGLLLGLLCLKRTHDGFCSDADVRARGTGRTLVPA